MSIISLALYGSRARGDEGEDSDIDLFAITDDSDYKMIVNGKTNIANYPRSLAFQRAESGDLFMLHIVSESRSIYDPMGEFPKLKERFSFKEDYSSEIKYASDIAWMLVDQSGESGNYFFVNKRIAWCVRTILIARAANSKKAIFSAEALSNFSELNFVVDLIRRKNESVMKKRSVGELRLFLSQFGYPRPLNDNSTGLDGYARLFSESENVMGQKTLSVLQSSAEDFYT